MPYTWLVAEEGVEVVTQTYEPYWWAPKMVNEPRSFPIGTQLHEELCLSLVISSGVKRPEDGAMRRTITKMNWCSSFISYKPVPVDTVTWYHPASWLDLLSISERFVGYSLSLILLRHIG